MKLYHSPVVFNEAAHTYTLGERTLSGITPVVAWVYPETYRDVPRSVLDAAAERGHKVHTACQMVDNLGLLPDDASDEVRAYIRLCRENGLRSAANEYLVSDERDVASSIDVVMRGENYREKEFTLADIKTTAALHREMVTLQLSLYAYLFEKQNAGAKVTQLLAVWLPKPQYGEPQIVKLSPRIPADDCERIIRYYLAGDREALKGIEAIPTLPSVETSANVPAAVRDAEQEIIQLETQLKEIKTKRDELQAGLLHLMKESGAKKYETERMLITYVAPSRRKQLDASRLKSEQPDLFARYLTETETRESVRIKVR